MVPATFTPTRRTQQEHTIAEPTVAPDPSRQQRRKAVRFFQFQHATKGHVRPPDPGRSARDAHALQAHDAGGLAIEFRNRVQFLGEPVKVDAGPGPCVHTPAQGLQQKGVQLDAPARPSQPRSPAQRMSLSTFTGTPIRKSGVMHYVPPRFHVPVRIPRPPPDFQRGGPCASPASPRHQRGAAPVVLPAALPRGATAHEGDPRPGACTAPRRRSPRGPTHPPNGIRAGTVCGRCRAAARDGPALRPRPAGSAQRQPDRTAGPPSHPDRRGSGAGAGAVYRRSRPCAPAGS